MLMEVDSKVIKELQTIATEKDITEQELIEEYITKGIEQDTKKARIITTEEELKKVLDYDNPEGDDILEKSCGIVNYDENGE